jgi:hypothetical protein
MLSSALLSPLGQTKIYLYCAGPQKLGARLRCKMEMLNQFPGECKDGQAAESQTV